MIVLWGTLGARRQESVSTRLTLPVYTQRHVLYSADGNVQAAQAVVLLNPLGVTVIVIFIVVVILVISPTPIRCQNDK